MPDDARSRDFAEILAAHEAMVWTLCLRMTGSRVLAQDAHQECFLRVWRGLDAFRGEARLSSWIWRIAVRCCRELLARERRLPLEASEEALDSLVDPAAPLDEAAAARDAQAFLLGLLKPRDRALVHLHYSQELSCEEIAAVMEMRPVAVRVALHRARAAMRAGWERVHGPLRTPDAPVALAQGDPA
jgi:RNA polymerase sigma-70 factor (ECF subfamily)